MLSLGRFGDIVVSEIREINPPCMAVNGMKKSGMMTSSAFDGASAEPKAAKHSRH